jgi:hypothetical protein
MTKEEKLFMMNFKAEKNEGSDRDETMSLALPISQEESQALFIPKIHNYIHV